MPNYKTVNVVVGWSYCLELQTMKLFPLTWQWQQPGKSGLRNYEQGLLKKTGAKNKPGQENKLRFRIRHTVSRYTGS